MMEKADQASYDKIVDRTVTVLTKALQDDFLLFGKSEFSGMLPENQKSLVIVAQLSAVCLLVIEASELVNVKGRRVLVAMIGCLFDEMKKLDLGEA